MNGRFLIRNPCTRWPVLGCLFAAFLAFAWFGRVRVVSSPKSFTGAAGKTSGSIERVTPLPELDVEKIVQHGHIVEIKAKVQPGTTVMVNGERAAVIWGEGEIRHFVGPLPDGMNEIAITVQDDNGGFKSQKIAVTLP